MKSAFGVGLSLVLEALLPLVRLVVLARLLPQDQFGIAVTVLVTIGIIEMCCDIGLAQSAVRGSTLTSTDRLIGTLHALGLARSAAMILIAIAVLSIQRYAFDTSFGVDAVVLAGLILALRALENLAIKPLTRSYNFWREAMLTGGYQIVWTGATVVAALATGSYASLFLGMLAGAAWSAIYSNLISPSRWHLDWDHAAAREALRFGAPLVPNGVASAVVTLDRLIVSAFLGTRAVAVYGVAIGLATLPRAVMYRFSVSVLVPHFANILHDRKKEQRFYAAWLGFVSIVAGVYGVALIVLGPIAIGFAFGPAYVPSDFLMALIAINAFIKFMMLVPLPAAFARGQTSVVFLGSLVSALATMPSALALLLGMKSLETFVLALNFCECAGLIWFLVHATRRHGLQRAAALAAIAAPLLALGSITARAWPGF